MPYGPGDSIKAAGAGKYTGKAKRAFKAAFNTCHAKHGEDGRCFRIAHAAAQRVSRD